MIIPHSAAAIVTGVGLCVAEELDATPESGGGLVANPKMRVCYLVPGNIAWDGCNCGQLALTIQNIFPSVVFPTPAEDDPTTSGCEVTQLAVRALVSITRCVPGPTNTGQPPTCASLLASALEQQGDAYAVRRAVACCLSEMKRTRRIWDWRIGSSNFVGPEGGCAGSELSFVFLLK